MRRVLPRLGLVLVGVVGLVLFGVFVLPYIALWLMFGWLAW